VLDVLYAYNAYDKLINYLNFSLKGKF